MLQAEAHIPVATLVGGVAVSIIGGLFGYALNRSSKQADTEAGQSGLLAAHKERLNAMEKQVAKLERLQEETIATLGRMALQLEGMRMAMQNSAGANARVTVIAEDIRRIVDSVRSSQKLDHTLLSQLTDRVIELESVIVPPYPDTNRE